eukprot:CAMPEP_0206467614 /NCGR_PEP_ID=MMETSP0324_2-20121206/29139_1 /ASSEMBLY_ACC=CAM_ASM_000836 /TAXON_ID=2866 /ORGANISM="Crypthecodinium cohnii, Strain Seligo" /LENGTH=51 /DNA_ID=CAMNT_0053940915 /DNA_START=505 /DNA_END=657 /DNA_ORIENTATION=-
MIDAGIIGRSTGLRMELLKLVELGMGAAAKKEEDVGAFAFAAAAVVVAVVA